MILHKKIAQDHSPEERVAFLSQLKKQNLSGAVLLQTCNRVELYQGNGDVPEDIARHLFRLVSGLESLFVGETFIQGQVKEAYQSASAGGNLDSSLHRLFQWALLTGKRVRSETAISRGAMSHSQAVVEIIRNTIPHYETSQFTFIGINKINKSIMSFLKTNVNTAFLLGNRTYETARELEQQYNCKAFRLDRLKESLAQTNIVITATSAPHAIIRKEHLPLNHALTIFDLAVPRDVELAVAERPNIHYYGIQDIESTVDKNVANRESEIIKALQIVEDELARFLSYQSKQQRRRSGKLVHEPI